MPLRTIHLNYMNSDANKKWTMTATTHPAAASAYSTGGAKAVPDVKPGQMSAIQAKAGDSLKWVVDTEGVTDFIVQLQPASAFEPAVFWPGSKPVKVKKKTKKAHAYCGFVYEGKLEGYPKDKSYGHSIDP